MLLLIFYVNMLKVSMTINVIPRAKDSNMEASQVIVPSLKGEYNYTPPETHHPVIKSSSTVKAIFKALGDFFGEQVGKIILSAKVKKEVLENSHQKQIDLVNAKLGKEIIIHDNAARVDLNAFAIEPKEPSARWIVVFNGMGDQYVNHVGALKKLADDADANILTFDYRSVGKSKGRATSMEDLIHDGEMVLDYLTNTSGVRVDPKNILFYGHSMGGGVAAKLHQKTNHLGPLLCESSFSTFAAAISVKRGRLVGYFVKLFNWDLDATKLFEKEKMKGKGFIVNRRDPTVRYEISLYHHLKKLLPAGTTIKRIKIGSKSAKENMTSTIEKIQVITKVIKKPLQKGEKVEKQPTSDFQKTMQKLKEKRIIHLIQHPHERIMDRVYSYGSESNRDKVGSRKQSEIAELIQGLYEKFKQEDEAAYEKILELIGENGELWSEVSLSKNQSLKPAAV